MTLVYIPDASYVRRGSGSEIVQLEFLGLRQIGRGSLLPLQIRRARQCRRRGGPRAVRAARFLVLAVLGGRGVRVRVRVTREIARRVFGARFLHFLLLFVLFVFLVLLLVASFPIFVLVLCKNL